MIDTVVLSFFLGAGCSIIACILYVVFQKRRFKQTKKSARILLQQTKDDVEHERKEALLRLKDELHKRRSDFDLEIKKSRIEFQRL